MEKQELIKILKKMAEDAKRLSKDFKGDEDEIGYDWEAWTLGEVIKMLENRKYYEEMKTAWIKEGK